jgi:hypothetical protein
MAMLKKDVLVPTLPEQRIVSVPELGGEVIVRPLLLADRLALANEPRDAALRAKSIQFGHIAALLTYAVVDGDGEQLLSTSEWEAFGALHIKAAMALWDAAFELSGLNNTEQPEKKSEAQNSSSQ